MREILFRGKRIDNGEWVYGYYARKGADKESFRHYICVSTFSSDYQSNYTYPFYLYDYEVDPLTVGQCVSGLTDKNGKKIFEGDIVDITQYDNVHHKAYRCCRAKVFFSNFAFRTNAAPEYEDEEPLSYWFWHDCDFEVIGNIHDNPELLEVTP